MWDLDGCRRAAIGVYSDERGDPGGELSSADTGLDQVNGGNSIEGRARGRTATGLKFCQRRQRCAHTCRIRVCCTLIHYNYSVYIT